MSTPPVAPDAEVERLRQQIALAATALVEGDPDEAYHRLYEAADPEFSIMGNPFEEWNTRRAAPVAATGDETDGLMLTFDVDFPGERAAGLHSFHDVVTVHLGAHPGEGGPDDDTFDEYMRKALADWYDCNVTLRAPVSRDETDGLTCPFCHEEDFDDVGLMLHFDRGHCEGYKPRPRRAHRAPVSSPEPE